MAPVFIVEDDKAVRDALRFALEVEGLNVHVYNSAATLLEEEAGLVGGCLVVDHFMPGMTGLELVETLRRRNCLVPSILITTRADRDLRRRAARAGVRAILEKPLSGGALVDCIRGALAEPPVSPILRKNT